MNKRVINCAGERGQHVRPAADAGHDPGRRGGQFLFGVADAQVALDRHVLPLRRHVALLPRGRQPQSARRQEHHHPVPSPSRHQSLQI